MAVYSFDFDEVERTKKELNEVASQLEGKLKSCKSNLDSELNSWKGTASNQFDNNTEGNYNTIMQDIDTIKGLSSYLDEASRVIEAAEDDLSSINI